MSAILTDLFPLILGYGVLVFVIGTLATLAGFFTVYLFVRLIHPLHRREVARTLREHEATEGGYGTA